MVCEAVLLRNGEEIQTLYWNGSLQETVEPRADCRHAGSRPISYY